MTLQNSDIGTLRKARAQFELKPLVRTFENDDDIPQEAVECSAYAMNTLLTLYASVEAQRNRSE